MPFRTSFDKDCKEYVQTNNIKRKSKVQTKYIDDVNEQMNESSPSYIKTIHNQS